MAPTNRRPGGWTVPGFKYLGPFNPLNNGEPINEVDKVAQTHDRAYQAYIDSGVNPYLNFNKADSDFIDSLSSDSSVAGWLGKSAFKLKRLLAPHLTKEKETANKGSGAGGKRPRIDPVRAQKRKYYFARQHQGKNSKQQKMENEVETAGDGQEGAPASDPRSGGNGGGGTGMGGGGHGVGVSTGGWKAGTVFSDTKIVTTSTRQFYAPIYNQHLYKKVVGEKNWIGITTPWAYFNFNEYDSHFTPNDWQRLTNEYAKWRPIKMHVKIYNLQIKQKVTLGADTLYNNDLTAGVHIFCDGSHQFPYSQAPWDHGTMPELPYDTWKLPQYAYFQFQADITYVGTTSLEADSVEKNIARAGPFFILESASHEVLRTGEETEFNFSFESGWVDNTRAYVLPQADINPMVQTRRYFPTFDRNSSTRFSYSRYSPYNKPSNWMPGPSIGYIGNTQPIGSDSAWKARGPITVCAHPYFTAPEGSGNTTNDHQSTTALPSVDGMQKSGHDVTPTNGACSRLDSIDLAYDSSEYSTNQPKLITRNIDSDLARWGSVWAQDGHNVNIDASGNTSGTRTNVSQLKNVWMYPNQAWDTTPIGRNNPIWDKIPNTDRHTMLDSGDGTLPMAHPPGTIFIKVAKVPVPTENNANSYLDLYVTGQVTCTIEWECKRFSTKNWRPEMRTTPAAFADPLLYTVEVDGTYNTPEVFTEAMPTKLGINKVL
uniref:Minor capsid protein VP1 n=2 Tax=Feline bocaparvovirus 3 TaxID=2259807 RepID=A0A7D4WAT6_9VIRU|nr:VP1 [Feline bocaparvovirus 3]